MICFLMWYNRNFLHPLWVFLSEMKPEVDQASKYNYEFRKLVREKNLEEFINTTEMQSAKSKIREIQHDKWSTFFNK